MTFCIFLQGTTRLLLTKIPFFREIVLMSFSCPHCNFTDNEVQPAGRIQDKGCRVDVHILTQKVCWIWSDVSVNERLVAIIVTINLSSSCDQEDGGLRLSQLYELSFKQKTKLIYPWSKFLSFLIFEMAHKLYSWVWLNVNLLVQKKLKVSFLFCNFLQDLNRQVVKSDTASIKIPELDLEIPGGAQKGSKLFGRSVSIDLYHAFTILVMFPVFNNSNEY